MELKEIMTEEEQSVVRSLIKANETVKVRKAELRGAEIVEREFAELLTDLFFSADEDDKRTSTIPERFVARYNGEFFLVEVDDEGGHNHVISRIGGILA